MVGWFILTSQTHQLIFTVFTSAEDTVLPICFVCMCVRKRYNEHILVSLPESKSTIFPMHFGCAKGNLFLPRVQPHVYTIHFACNLWERQVFAVQNTCVFVRVRLRHAAFVDLCIWTGCMCLLVTMSESYGCSKVRVCSHKLHCQK